ncbi:MAG TPA: hypothetical protein EYP59_11925 [Thiotrichaceae bacterium]|nr:hypothetical protein [Thiotrichaceae bacterium]
MSKSKIHLKDHTIDLDVPFLTPDVIERRLRKEIGEKRKIAVAQSGGSELKPTNQLPNNTNLGTEVRVKIYPGGTQKGVYSRRETYIKAHVASVAEAYGERYGQSVQLDRQLNFVFIPRFTLPRKWGTRTTPLLVWLPQQYPDVPPNGFYLSKNCDGPHIFSRNVYGDSPDLSSKGWNWFCVHCNDGWHPNEDPTKDDNLWTFLDVVRLSLSIDEF